MTFFSIVCTAQHLESESRDKQLQLERRRKASLFISMLKNTNPGDETEATKYDDCLHRYHCFMVETIMHLSFHVYTWVCGKFRVHATP